MAHQRLLRHVQKALRLQPGRPALGLGLRAAVAVTGPFLLASAIGLRGAGWTGLTGLLVTLADRGGSYQGRARVMGSVALLGAVIGGLAAPLGGHLPVDALLLFLAVFATSFARCFGETAGATGEKLAVIFVASLGAHVVGLEGALARGAALLFGGGWAIVQALVLWPVHPHRPARRAIASVYFALAQAARELATLSREAVAPEEWAAGISRHAGLRRTLEEARQVLAATRVGSHDQPRRSEHLLVLLELGELVLSILFALAHAMEIASPEAWLRPAREQVAAASEGFAATADRVAVIVRDPGRPAHQDPHAARLEGLPANVSASGAQLPSSVCDLLSRLRNEERGAWEAALAMQHRLPTGRALPSGAVAHPKRPLLQPLRENLHRGSVVLRHATRAGLVAAAALIAARGMRLGEAYWVVLSAIGILQPYSASTEERALQRVSGTLLGGALAAGIAATIGSQAVLLGVIGVLTAISVSLLPLNFGAFQILLTPDFLLLASLNRGDWTVAENRALGVLIACVLALAGAWLLWPIPERKRFPEAAANVLDADGRYFRQIARGHSARTPEVRAARRDFGLALLDAEASFERLAAEARGPPQRLEPAMALLAYSRRLAGSVTTLAEQREERRPSAALEAVADEVSGTLGSLADSLRDGRAPPPLPPLPVRKTTDDPVSGVLVERVPRQLEILHGAVEKLTLEATAPVRWPAGRTAPAS